MAQRVACADGLFAALDIAEIADAAQRRLRRGERSARRPRASAWAWRGCASRSTRCRPTATGRPWPRLALGDDLAGLQRAHRPGRAAASGQGSAAADAGRMGDSATGTRWSARSGCSPNWATPRRRTWRCCRWRCGSCATWLEGRRTRAGTDLRCRRAARLRGAAAAHGLARAPAAACRCGLAAGRAARPLLARRLWFWRTHRRSAAREAEGPSAVRSARWSARAMSSGPIRSRGRASRIDAGRKRAAARFVGPRGRWRTSVRWRQSFSRGHRRKSRIGRGFCANACPGPDVWSRTSSVGAHVGGKKGLTDLVTHKSNPFPVLVLEPASQQEWPSPPLDWPHLPAPVKGIPRRCAIEGPCGERVRGEMLDFDPGAGKLGRFARRRTVPPDCWRFRVFAVCAGRAVAGGATDRGRGVER